MMASVEERVSNGSAPVKRSSACKVKRSSAWITRVINCKQSKQEDVRLQQMSSIESNIWVYRPFKIVGGDAEA